ncbi:MAG: DUF2070 family protein, partial [Candidatus Methanomethylicia archaeon]
ALERELNKCFVCVPLGLVGHDRDLTSQKQMQKLIDNILKSTSMEVKDTEATRFVKVSNELATCCCQAFGDMVLMSFSLSPNTTEDLPEELSTIICRELENLGFKSCVLMNAHNSIDGVLNVDVACRALEDAALKCLRDLALMGKAKFRMGVAHIMPKEFSLKDGMGPGGITIIAIEVDGQRVAYIVIDGNNMVSGLREKILESIKSIGFDDGEVFTTDTHLVTALTLSERGYHPIGEVVKHEVIIGYILETAKRALENLEWARTGFRNMIAPNVKVIGRRSLENLTILIDKAVRRAKLSSIPIFGSSFLALILMLMVI